MSYISELSDLGIELKGRTSGLHKTTCPQCSHNRKNKKDPCLSVNISEGLYNCHNCSWSGNVGIKAARIEKKVYALPVVNNTGLSDKSVEWFNSRGISKTTIKWWKITENVRNSTTWINFNYFRRETLTNVKYRKLNEKSFLLTPNAELIFYGLDFIDGKDSVIITEGEMDALSFFEAGLMNVVSVPNGASKGSMKLEYLDNCFEYFEDKKKIILALDGDEPGRALMEELARRLGKERCFIFQYPEGAKDANEILIQVGPEGLKKYMDFVIEYPLEGVTSIIDIEDRVNAIYEKGWPKGRKVGFMNLDDLITWREGEFTAFTGIPGSGKSEFIDQVMIRLSELHDWKWGVFSAENQPEELHFSKLAEKYIGKPFYVFNQELKMNPEELYRAKVFVNERFFFLNIDDKNVTLDGLLSKGRELILRKGINGMLIDPWNYIEHKIPSGYTETQYISEALTRISRFAKVNNIHVIVVAHPTKIGKDADGSYKVATMYDIAGSAHWFNKIDNGVSVYRDFTSGIIDVHVQKIRFKFIGKIGKASFTWDKHSGRYEEASGF
jgi:twinkle protein